MIHCTLRQNKLRVEQDTDVLPFQYSNNINIQFIKDSTYENYVVTPYYAWVPTKSIPPRKLDAFALPLKDGVFTLPMNAFVKDGYLGIAFSLTDGNEVLQTDPVYLAVQSSVGSNNILPENDSWQLVVIDTVNSYIELNVNDKLQALIKEVAKLDENSAELQREVNELIDKVNKMLEDGDFIPEHKWENTFLHFKNPDGSWDSGVNLKGPSGVYFGNDMPPEDGEYNVWVLPDGTPDFEIYADQVKTQDGSNVQQKINNSFSLGSDRDGIPYIQNENGRVWLNKTDLNSAVYTGMYYCTETLNRPNSKDGYLQVIATNDNYAMQRFTDNDNIPRTFERVMSNGAWSSWVEMSSLIETGATNGLRYYKYSDGRLTYIVNATTQATITSAHGSVYISGLRSMDSYKYPVGFSSIPTVTATVGANGDNVLVWIAIGDNITAYDAPPDFYICKGTSDSTSRSYRVGMVVEGRWR